MTKELPKKCNKESNIFSSKSHLKAEGLIESEVLEPGSMGAAAPTFCKICLVFQQNLSFTHTNYKYNFKYHINNL